MQLKKTGSSHSKKRFVSLLNHLINQQDFSELKKIPHLVLSFIPSTKNLDKPIGPIVQGVLNKISRVLEVKQEPFFNISQGFGPQKNKNKQGRFEGIRETLQLNLSGPIPVNVLIVDDITTSRATLMEAARKLKKLGVRSVTGLAFAITELDGDGDLNRGPVLT